MDNLNFNSCDDAIIRVQPNFGDYLIDTDESVIDDRITLISGYSPYNLDDATTEEIVSIVGNSDLLTAVGLSADDAEILGKYLIDVSHYIKNNMNKEKLPNIDGYIYSIGVLDNHGIHTIDVITTDLQLAASSFISGEANCKEECKVMYIWKDNVSVMKIANGSPIPLTWLGLYDPKEIIAQHVFSDMCYLSSQISKGISNDHMAFKAILHSKLDEKVGEYYNNKYKESMGI